MLPAIDLSGTARPSAERAFAESRLTLDLFVDVCIEHAKDHAYAKSVGENLGLTQKRDLPQNNEYWGIGSDEAMGVQSLHTYQTQIIYELEPDADLSKIPSFVSICEVTGPPNSEKSQFLSRRARVIFDDLLSEDLSAFGFLRYDGAYWEGTILGRPSVIYHRDAAGIPQFQLEIAERFLSGN